MRVRREPDGSVEIRESPWLLRAALLVGAVAVPWGILAVGSNDPGRTVLGVLASLCMIAGALLVEARRFRFDCSLGVLNWHRSRMVGSRSGALPFSAISGVVAQPRMDDDNPRTRRLSYRPVLLTSEGEMPLSNTTSRSPDDYQELLSLVRAAIGQAESVQESSIVALVRAGRTVDAITLARRQRGISLEQAKQRVEQFGRDRDSKPPDQQ